MSVMMAETYQDAEPAQPLPPGSGRCRRNPGVPVRSAALVLDPSNLRRFHRVLATRLETEAGVRVSMQVGEIAAPLPSSVDLLLSLEAMLTKSPGPRLSEKLGDEPAPWIERREHGLPDILIDLCGDAAATQPTIRILYDGCAGERALVGALLAGRMPAIEIEDAQEGRILARGVPCADNARTVIEALDCVLARVIDLLILSLRGWESLAEAREPTRSSCRLRDLVALEARTLPYTVARYLYRLCCYAPHWRSCWRFVDGPDLWDTGTLSGSAWNVIPDPGYRFYADPFPFRHKGKDWIFVEDFDHRTAKGVISVIPFGADGPDGPVRTVLEEPWHLSYPFLFTHRGETWMMPESSADRSVNLYRAASFPDRWVREATLIDDIEASDATMFQHGGCYWIFAATRSDGGSWSDSLSIFSAPDPLGPWTPHPGNPVLIDQAAARPAGAVIRRGNRLCRPVQDCSRGYGTGIGLAEIVRLDREGYEQRLHTVLRPETDWPGKRLHTLNRVGRLECIDGSAHSPRVFARTAQALVWQAHSATPALALAGETFGA